MAKKRGVKGKMLSVGAPEWEPLRDLAGRHVDEFMWMFAVELADGTRLQAYKHCETRGYLHLDGQGRAFVYVEPDRYLEESPRWLLSRVLDEDLHDLTWYDILRPRRLSPDDIRLHWVPAATAQGISRERSAHVVRSCGLRFTHRTDQESPAPDQWPILFVGEDAEGMALEVAAIAVREEEFLVFHAREMREEYGWLLGRASEWRL